MSKSLRIDLPTASLAVSLLERLEDFRAEIYPLRGERYQVVVELDGERGADERAREGVARIESWLETVGHPAEIHLNDRPSRLASDGSPLPARDTPESVGLVCRIKTIALGSGVQVVSAEGELDFHTAPQLDDLLRSTESDHVVLDLTETTFVASTAMSVIVASMKRLRGEGRQLSIVSGNPTVAHVLEITGLDRTLEVQPTLAEAIETALDRAVDELEAHRKVGSAR